MIPNTADALVAATVARLTARIPELVVEAFPDKPEDYDFLHPVGAILVRYKGSTYGTSLDTGVIVQERAIQIELTLLTRSANGSSGATTFIEHMRLAVTGWTPPAFQKCRPVRDEFLDQQGGQWRHALDFATTTLAIEEDEISTAPICTQIVVIDGAVINGGRHEKVHVPRP